MPRRNSPLLSLPSLLPGACNESSLCEHDSITLDFITPEKRLVLMVLMLDGMLGLT
jgi:hypothetical protein